MNPCPSGGHRPGGDGGRGGHGSTSTPAKSQTNGSWCGVPWLLRPLRQEVRACQHPTTTQRHPTPKRAHCGTQQHPVVMSALPHRQPSQHSLPLLGGPPCCQCCSAPCRWRWSHATATPNVTRHHRMPEHCPVPLWVACSDSEAMTTPNTTKHHKFRPMPHAVCVLVSGCGWQLPGPI